jgi:hypothetical protein
MSLPNDKMVQKNYTVLPPAGPGHSPIKMWNKHVKIEEKAIEQLVQVASMPFAITPRRCWFSRQSAQPSK